jgi:hypothetical protein
MNRIFKYSLVFSLLLLAFFPPRAEVQSFICGDRFDPSCGGGSGCPFGASNFDCRDGMIWSWDDEEVEDRRGPYNPYHGGGPPAPGSPYTAAGPDLDSTFANGYDPGPGGVRVDTPFGSISLDGVNINGPIGDLLNTFLPNLNLDRILPFGGEIVKVKKCDCGEASAQIKVGGPLPGIFTFSPAFSTEFANFNLGVVGSKVIGNAYQGGACGELKEREVCGRDKEGKRKCRKIKECRIGDKADGTIFKAGTSGERGIGIRGALRDFLSGDDGGGSNNSGDERDPTLIAEDADDNLNDGVGIGTDQRDPEEVDPPPITDFCPFGAGNC